MKVGRPKDLEKRQQILDAAKALFLMHGFHGSSMNQIAKAASVTKLTVYNHFQDKENLFTCAIAETCEESIDTRTVSLDQHSDFNAALQQLCKLAINLVNLPEALKLEHLLLELAAEQNPLVLPFYDASHNKLLKVWKVFFQKAIALNFIQDANIEKQIHLLISLLLGQRHHEVLLGIRKIPNVEERQLIVEEAIEIFMLKYQKN